MAGLTRPPLSSQTSADNNINVAEDTSQSQQAQTRHSAHKSSTSKSQHFVNVDVDYILEEIIYENVFLRI